MTAPGNVPALGEEEIIRAYIEGHQVIIDGPDESFTRELAPSAREPLAALDRLVEKLREAQEEKNQLIEKAPVFKCPIYDPSERDRAEAAEEALRTVEEAVRSKGRTNRALGERVSQLWDELQESRREVELLKMFIEQRRETTALNQWLEGRRAALTQREDGQ